MGAYKVILQDFEKMALLISSAEAKFEQEETSDEVIQTWQAEQEHEEYEDEYFRDRLAGETGMEILDEEAEKPEGWLDDEPEEIEDPEATKPEDWDDEEDGEWEAPKIDNPKCEAAPGCGEWKRPMKRPTRIRNWTSFLLRQVRLPMVQLTPIVKALSLQTILPVVIWWKEILRTVLNWNMT